MKRCSPDPPRSLIGFQYNQGTCLMHLSELGTGRTVFVFLLIPFRPLPNSTAERQFSSPRPLADCVLQGLVLSSIRGEVARRFGLWCHKYAEDVQLSLVLPSDPKMT